VNMKTKTSLLLLSILTVWLTLSACAQTSTTVPIPPAVIDTATDTATEPVIAPDITNMPVEQPSPTSTQIVHLDRPDAPIFIDTQSVEDCSVGERYTAGEPVRIPPSCDLWDIDYVERPTDAAYTTYYPYLDIEKIQFGATIDWLFARIETYEPAPPQGTSGVFYAIELDLDFDSLSDVLISIQDLKSSDVVWTVNGLRAWRFTDGVTTQVFDQGLGIDPDLIWARRTPDGVVEIGFKPSLLDGDLSFGWWAWAYQGSLDATQFIPLDTLIDTTYAIDNTCAFGFNGDASSLPNVCR
jgi:hypothetical protein